MDQSRNLSFGKELKESDIGSPKEHPYEIWLKVIQQFQRRRSLIEKFTDGSMHGHQTQPQNNSPAGLWPMEVKSKHTQTGSTFCHPRC